MNTSWKLAVNPSPEQEAIRAKCFHPSGTFVEFPIEEVETSIPARFEKIVRLYPERLAVKMGDQAQTYDELNQADQPISKMESYNTQSET
jgi:non-ribosomal peptide synthetase component F